MKRNQTFFITAIVIFLIIISSYIIFSDLFKPYKYSFVEENTEFVSDYKHPGIYLQELSRRDSFIVSPEFVLSGPINSSMTESLTLFSVVLTGEGKEVVSLGRIMDGQDIVKCQTNEGDPSINKEISAEECGRILSESGSVLFLIVLPDPELERAQVIAYENKILIKPKTYEDVARVSALVLRAMFEGSDETIEKVNLLVGRLG